MEEHERSIAELHPPSLRQLDPTSRVGEVPDGDTGRIHETPAAVQQRQRQVLLLASVSKGIPEAARLPEGLGPRAEAGPREREGLEPAAGPRARRSSEDPCSRIHGVALTVQDAKREHTEPGIGPELPDRRRHRIVFVEAGVVVDHHQEIPRCALRRVVTRGRNAHPRAALPTRFDPTGAHVLDPALDDLDRPIGGARIEHQGFERSIGLGGHGRQASIQGRRSVQVVDQHAHLRAVSLVRRASRHVEVPTLPGPPPRPGHLRARRWRDP